MAPEHLGSMVLLQSWPLLLAQRAHAPGKIHNFQRSEVCWGGCSLKKQCGLKLGLENVVLFFWFVFVAMLGYLFCWLSYFISDDCDKWCLMMVAFILTWKTAESNRMKQPDHFCLPSNLRLQLRGTLPLRHLLCPSVVSLLAADFWLRPFHATECLKECPQLQVSYEIHNSPVWSEGWNLP